MNVIRFIVFLWCDRMGKIYKVKISNISSFNSIGNYMVMFYRNIFLNYYSRVFSDYKLINNIIFTSYMEGDGFNASNQMC